MEVTIQTQEDENFKIVKETEVKVEVAPEVVKQLPERPQATLENPKGHSWFNGTSWGVK